MKSSAESAKVSGEIGEVAEKPFEIGGERIGVTKQEEGLHAEIAEKEKKRDALLKTYRDKFAEYVKKRDDRAASQATLLRQKMARLEDGQSLSDKDQADLAEYASVDAVKDDEDRRDAEAYKRDAVDLDKEISLLKDKADGIRRPRGEEDMN